MGGKTILSNSMPLFLRSQVKWLKKNSMSLEDTANLNINYWRRNSCQGVNLYRRHPHTSVPKLVLILMHFNFFWHWKISPKIGLCGFLATDPSLSVWKAGRCHFIHTWTFQSLASWSLRLANRSRCAKSLRTFLKEIFKE